MVAIDHQAMHTAIPIRSPTLSTNSPPPVYMIVYENKNADRMFEYCWALM